ncbi:6797_t:CDS:10 [Diversispora eburnea]|uniref:Dynactin subunit 4 n=1 Tax=Diversispora eburnea TaxID=1213867 RepID=A0A9N8ZIZ3_9GLOM|nr:6797_t:CDS:10 [Diversispora eburnea]
MSTLPDTRQLAYVHYHCLCPDVYNKSTSSSTTTNTTIVANADEPITEKTKIPKIPQFDVNSPRVNFSTFPISKLYFCDDCHQIRCPRCVQEEIVCYYCPNCLFEVPTASVKSERNRCARNCFQCPICQNTLSVTASAEAQSVTTVPSSLSMMASGAPFYLTCGVCRWDSQEIGMNFEKATGLALQLQKTEDEKPDVKEFDHLKEHFEKHIRQNTPSTSLPSSLLSIPGMSISIEYEAITKVENDTGLIEDLAQLKVINQSYDQPYKVERLQPQRIHLRTKRIKRCRSCRHILIKPEQKAQATRFKIKLVALKFTKTISQSKNSNIEILAPNFYISPYNDIWEYEEPELVSAKSRSHSSSSGANAKNDIGIYERRGNYTSIIVEITPLSEVEEFKFPLLVTYTTKSYVVNQNAVKAASSRSSISISHSHSGSNVGGNVRSAGGKS